MSKPKRGDLSPWLEPLEDNAPVYMPTDATGRYIRVFYSMCACSVGIVRGKCSPDSTNIYIKKKPVRSSP